MVLVVNVCAVHQKIDGLKLDEVPKKTDEQSDCETTGQDLHLCYTFRLAPVVCSFIHPYFLHSLYQFLFSTEYLIFLISSFQERHNS